MYWLSSVTIVLEPRTTYLEPDIWLLHEVWDPHLLRNAFPTGYQQIVGAHVGQGQGYVVAYERSRVCNDRQPMIQADIAHWLTVLYPDTYVGTLLVTNVHLSPHLSFRERKAHIENMDAVR